MAAHEKPENKYKNTLNLPRTDFPIRPNSGIDDPALVARWQEEDLYNKTFAANKGEEKFILHHGPPYANGHLHVGHAYTTILKDIVTKSQRMLGKNVPVTPGWDCHGLPIEFKVTQENPGLSRTALKEACRAYAQYWINIQREEFKRMGIVMDWDHPYTTMSPSYEASTLNAFAEFVSQGYIERKNKTVPWCPFDQTVLATAEIEYHERKDPSIYVLFPLENSVTQKLWPDLKDNPVSLVIWTTTPWTLPLNRAILIRPHTEYALVFDGVHHLIIAAALVPSLEKVLEHPLEIKHKFSAEHLMDLKPQAQHPFIPDQKVPLIFSDTVQLTDGTALVHCAPGCGPEDYDVGLRNKLEIYSPISTDGKYTPGIKPEALEGMSVTDGQIWVIKELAAQKKLLAKGTIRHSYPHCWRCRNGLIFRATKQWFCDLSRNNLKQKAIDAVDNTLKMLPEGAKNQFRATLDGRLEWCLSRQRVWGVPIPALLCKSCDHTYITAELVNTVAAGVAKQGIEYWDSVTIDQLVPKDFVCPSCKKSDLVKEQDILDVWFDSGISHYAVLSKNPALAFPADVYLEGKDQNRGWFQSSLLTALVLEKQAPMKQIITHGFTVDEQGRKMSKSLGNVVTPAQMIEKLGTDGLRLWASSIDYADDAVVSPILIENVKEVFRKVRNTARFLLSNVYDYDHERDAIALDQLLPIDTYALHELILINAEVIDAYERDDFTAVFHLLNDYCVNSLSALYLDIVKDRLYVEKADGIKRRSAQTVCWYILDTMTRLMAPIFSFTAEQLSDHYQKNKTQSIHLQQFADLAPLWHELNGTTQEIVPNALLIDTRALAHIKETLHEQEYMQCWQELLALRSAVLKSIEKIREQGIVKHSLEVRLTLGWNESLAGGKKLFSFFNALENKNGKEALINFFKEFFIVSQVVITEDVSSLQSTEYQGLFSNVEHALGNKCPRCWHWEVNDHPDHLCRRCQQVVNQQ